MGGSAFTQHGLRAQRVDQPTYEALKSFVLPRLQHLYERAQVPRPAPEKDSHGDVDVFVMVKAPFAAPDAQVAETLRAVRYLQEKPTSNFAIPVDVLAVPPQAGDASGTTSEIFQVDVHECTCEADWDVGMLMNEFGDLGMILGRLVRGICDDLALGTHGLRLRTHLPFHPWLVLSQSSSEILTFLGLDIEQHRQGFITLQAMFAWVSSSRFFHPSLCGSTAAQSKSTSRERKREQVRSGYARFLDYVAGLDQRESTTPSRQNALDLVENFGKGEELRTLLREDQRRRELKEALGRLQLARRLGLSHEEARWTIEDRRRLGHAYEALRKRAEAGFGGEVPTPAAFEALADEVVAGM